MSIVLRQAFWREASGVSLAVARSTREEHAMADATPGTQPLVTGRSRLYAIIGDPIEQVKSPEILNPVMAAAG
jgi:hypothetical protein